MNWETNLKERRKIVDEPKPKWSRQLPNYLPFLMLGLVCVMASIISVLPLETTIKAITEFDWSQTVNFIINNTTLSNIILLIFWVLSPCFLFIWAKQMRDCFSSKTQLKNEAEILEATHQEAKSNNTK